MKNKIYKIINIISLLIVLPLIISFAENEFGTVKNYGNESVLQDETIIKKTAPITNLPFNAHFEQKNMGKLTEGSRSQYVLPEIKKYKFISTDPDKDTICNDKYYLDTPLDIGSIFRFKSYRYRFPDISGYNVFLVCDTTSLPSMYKKEEIEKKTCYYYYIYNITGFLLLYNPETKTANIIDIFHQNTADDNSKTFDIDNDFVITMQSYISNYEYIIDDLGEVIGQNREPIKGLKCWVNILPDGKIQVKYPESEASYDVFAGKPYHVPPTTIIYSPEGEVISKSTRQ